MVDDKLCDAVAVPQNHKPITALVVYPTTQADVYVGVRLVQLPAVVCPLVKLLLDGRGFCNKPCVQTSDSTVHLSVQYHVTKPADVQVGALYLSYWLRFCFNMTSFSLYLYHNLFS